MELMFVPKSQQRMNDYRELNYFEKMTCIDVIVHVKLYLRD